jgi:hypothetical protein
MRLKCPNPECRKRFETNRQIGELATCHSCGYCFQALAADQDTSKSSAWPEALGFAFTALLLFGIYRGCSSFFSSSGTRPESASTVQDGSYSKGYQFGLSMGREWAAKGYRKPTRQAMFGIANARAAGDGATDVDAYMRGMMAGCKSRYGDDKDW